MRKLFTTLFAAVAAVLMVSFLASCGPAEEPGPSGGGGNSGGGGHSGGGSSTIAVTQISLNEISIALEVGGTLTLTATVSPSDATDKTVSWSSSDKSVATVENGKITGVEEGSATITATAGGKTVSCLVTVRDNTERDIKAILMEIYNAMGGPNWKIRNKWEQSRPLSDWEGIEWNKKTKELGLSFNGEFGLKGESRTALVV
ncbi:MAG: Ig domain-containing protein [Bacteroidales bacterium]|nr:Ig domain-containing protein [Bacteroidales bacterium]